MREWNLPFSVASMGNDGKHLLIRNKCDYRVVLDCICALNDVDLAPEERLQCALFIFYEDWTQITDVKAATEDMYNVISGGKSGTSEKQQIGNEKTQLMNWEHDFDLIVSAITASLGYDVRTPGKYTHWYTFLAAYFDIRGECLFSTVISIRSKRASGKKLDKAEIEFMRKNRDLVELPKQMTAEEKELLEAEW